MSAPAVTIPDDLRAVNARLAECERAKDAEGLRPLLDDALVFRRAGGAVVGKEEYLAGVPDAEYARLVPTIVAYHGTKDSAVVAVLVDARVTRDGRVSEGRYGNLRVFVPGGSEGWLLRVWVNVPAEDVAICAGPGG